ncbi:Rrf2 family transcriptional regulator [Labrenzia sp. R4_1]|uniref:RrF2 family transcriptional regulator n=1 Tax=Labrenzia sp. R4_1 TaxID=2821106 RepID=UPI001ADB548C|nr:Rrf2 family transcriptional regulator [Labrenzia sp. R4_1]MBO9424159.1 Rrf2 family transcriptional regulator [Labrenzia sp. R4_1]
MRLTTRTNLAMRTLMFCGVHPQKVVTKGEISRACHAKETHIAQVVNLLSQKGYLKTIRGRGGGILLARTASEINVGEVIRAFEDTTAFAECFQGAQNTCPLTPACRLKSALSVALGAFYGALDGLTLEDLVGGNTALADLLVLEPTAGAAA